MKQYKFNTVSHYWNFHKVKRTVISEEKGRGVVIIDYKENEMPFIWNLVVNEEERRKGLGNQLLDAAERIISEDYYTCDLDWSPFDSPSYVLLWYMRRGYKPVKETETYTNLVKTLKELPMKL